MPQFNLKHLRAGKYNNNNGEVSYSNAVKVGDAMNVNLELRFAEARLYAEGRLAEYLREAIGGTASMGVKYILDEAQKLMFSVRSNTRTVNGKEIPSTKFGANDTGSYIGLSFYADDMIDGVKKYTCALVTKARFSYPSIIRQTKGQDITFQTPTTTGEFLPDDSSDLDLIEVATCETEEDAAAWCDLVVNYNDGGTQEGGTQEGSTQEGSTQEGGA